MFDTFLATISLPLLVPITMWLLTAVGTLIVVRLASRRVHSEREVLFHRRQYRDKCWLLFFWIFLIIYPCE